MVVKAGLTIITFGIKLPAGIFIPTLGVGACAGRVVGILMQYLQVRNPDARLFRGCNGDLDCKDKFLHDLSILTFFLSLKVSSQDCMP
jgi:chloride channel 3/4/5